jgi:hypothetical protein
MNKTLDDLFKSKLRDHTIDPSANGWSRVAAGLTKKNKTIIWYRAVAAILIVGLGSGMWLYTNQDIDQTLQIVQADQEKPLVETNENSNSALKVIQEEPQVIKKAEPKRSTAPLAVQDKSVSMQSAKQDQQKEIIPQAIEVAMLDKNETSELIASNTAEDKPIVIVYELKPIVKKTTDPFEMDLEPQKKNGLKKMLEVANDMRTGESPLGGLRQAKEEIFAFNFRKDEKTNK